MSPALMRWDVLNDLLSVTSGRRYLEIGVQRGVNGVRVQAAERWGVDPHPHKVAERLYRQFFRQTSDTFFATLPASELFDVVFIDGLHHAEQVLRDAENALAHLAPGGFVVLHDCNPKTELAQRVPRQSGVWNGDCWRALVALRCWPDLDVFTIDADHGIGIVRRAHNPEPLSCNLERLTYRELEADRVRLLGLVPADRWHGRLGHLLELGRVVVVSANYGGRDSVEPAPEHDVDEYVLFTDSDEPVQGWRLERQSMAGLFDPRLRARRAKTLALDLIEDADVIVWIDGRIRAYPKPLRPLLRSALSRHDIAGFPHPWRSTVEAEAVACARLQLAPPQALEAQFQAYEADGFPDTGGLLNTMVLARRRTPAMLELGRRWWEEIRRHTPRDQVSLPYLLWKMGLSCGRLGTDVYRPGATPFWGRGKHRGQRT